MHASSLEDLESKIGHSFKNKEVLIQALTHKSYIAEDKRRNYEVLEFLGDSIINLLVVDILVSEFGNLREGELAVMKAFFVSEEFLADLAQDLDLGSHIRANIKKSIKTNNSILADVFEALWASIYLDSGKDLNYVKEVFNRLYRDMILDKARSYEYKRDYKTILQETTQRIWKERPIYRIIEMSGPQHNRLFEVECSIRDHRSVGVGRSKKEAEQLAAKKLLEMLHPASC